MNAEPPPFIDMPGSDRQALSDLLTKGGLVSGDVLCVTEKSKLGHGAGAARVERQLAKLGVTVEVLPSPLKVTARRKKRLPDADDLKYLKSVWASALEPDAAVAQATRHMGFPINRNWLNYHVCQRDGSPSTKIKKEQDHG